MKAKLTATTPVGTFTRTTHRAYQFVNVWRDPEIGTPDCPAYKRNDEPYFATWHGTREMAGKAAASSFKWAEYVGLFQVDSH